MKATFTSVDDAASALRECGKLAITLPFGYEIRLKLDSNTLTSSGAALHPAILDADEDMKITNAEVMLWCTPQQQGTTQSEKSDAVGEDGRRTSG